MKKNSETGKYEATKLIKLTNQELVGVGNTKEEAKVDLKAKLKAYRESSMDVRLHPTGEEIRSPGYTYSMNDIGRVNYKTNPDRKAQVYARPDLAQHIKDSQSKA